MIARDDVHRMVDAVPDEKLAELREALAGLVDPVLLAFMEAPEDDEPTTQEDLAALAEGRAELARGETIPLAAVFAELAADARA